MAYPANFIPEIWSKKVLKNLDEITVMANLVNKDYEGEIKAAGDTVHIRQFGDVTINPYVRDQTISFETLTDPMVDLLIDEQHYFAFKVDDMDKAQSDINILEGYTKRGAVAIRDHIDRFLLSKYTEVDSGNVQGTSGAPIDLTPANIGPYIYNMQEQLDAAKVPAEDRHLIITPRMRNKLTQSDEFTKATVVGDETARNGFIGKVGGFSVHVTTNYAFHTGTTAYPIIALHKMAITHASQIAKVENVRPSNMFADAVKGLYLYGAKVVQPTAMALLWDDNTAA